MRILVTGASGFTGRHFIHQAQLSGHECVALSKQTEGDLASAIRADISNKIDLSTALKNEQFDVVVHLAAISFVEHGDVGEIYETNLLGTINLIDVVREQAKKSVHFLIASSGNVYGNTQELPISEKNELSPVNDYAASKCAMEMALRVRAQDSKITIVRPFNYTGVGQAEHFLIPKIVKAFKENNKEIELGNIDVFRDFSDVRDVVSAYLALIERSCEGIFNICSGKPTSLFQVLELCESLFGKKLDVKVNPGFVRKNEVKTLYGSDLKLREAIGEYRQYNLKQTLEWMFKY